MELPRIGEAISSLHKSRITSLFVSIALIETDVIGLLAIAEIIGWTEDRISLPLTGTKINWD